MKLFFVIIILFLIVTNLYAGDVIWENTGNSAEITCAKLSANKQLLVLGKHGTHGDKLQVWDLTKKEKKLDLDISSVRDADISSDNRYLCYLSKNHYFGVIDLNDNSFITKDTLEYVTYYIKFIPNSINKVMTIAAAKIQDDDLFVIYDYNTHQIAEKIVLQEGSDYIGYAYKYLFTPDGKYLITSYFTKYMGNDSSAFNDVIFYNTETKEIIRKKMQNDNISNFCLSPDGKSLVTFGTNLNRKRYSVFYWDIATGDTIRTFIDSTENDGNVIHFDESGNNLLIYFMNEGICNFNITTGKTDTISYFNRLLTNYFLFNDKEIASCEDNNIFYWSFSNDPHKGIITSDTLSEYDINFHKKPLMAIDVSPDKKLIASGGEDQLVKIWDCDNGNFLYNLSANDKSEIWDLKFSNKGDKIAWTTDSCLIISDVQKNNTTIEVNTLVKYGVWDVAWSPDDKYLAASPYFDSVYIYDSQTGEKLYGFFGGFAIKCIVFSPDGKILAVSNHLNNMTVWNFETRKKLFDSTISIGLGVTDLDFSSDCKYLTASCSDGFAKVFNTESWDIVRTFSSKTIGSKVNIDTIAVTLSRFSLDNKSIYGVVDGYLKVWDFQTGKTYKVYEDYYPNGNWITGESITDLDISSDGSFIVTATRRGSVIKWNGTGEMGIEDHMIESDLFTISPNPANDFIEIKPKDILITNQAIECSIIALDGNIIRKFNLFSNSIFKLNVSELIPGTYLLRYKIKNSIEINGLKKFIISK